jgi:Universal stress protein family
LEEAGRRILQNYSEKSTNEYKIASETILAQGYPPDAIIRQADARGADIIFVGSRGFSGAKQFFIGSIPNSILHHSSIPVLLVKIKHICIEMKYTPSYQDLCFPCCYYLFLGCFYFLRSAKLLI